MRRAFFVLLSTLALLPSAACARPASSAEMPAAVQWSVDSRGRSDGKVQFELSYRTAHSNSVYSRTADVSELGGLSRAALQADAAGPVRFRLTRDAGSFACEGMAGRGRGSGDCRFEPGRAFAAELARRGYGAASDVQLFDLAMSDIGLAFADELQRQGYARSTIDELAEAGHHGVNAAYLRDMGALGYRAGRLQALIRMRDHGVSVDYVRSLADNGLRAPAPDGLVQLRDHGVSGAFVRDLATLGYGGLAPDEIVRLRDYGVTSEFIRRANAGGVRRSPEELVRLRTGG
ncbi:MAG: hypothetical protein JOZ90_04015 [Alphaproteobacteria bacterium]|nr:hypothetical protein [Alphaproteobacteria bacterium]MBV9373157.1 hypothetical protein [Alphaproteobacteria bacterium]MBV9900246.1 hypothetical protein [Alphaproteobacteria bacterium]